VDKRGSPRRTETIQLGDGHGEQMVNMRTKKLVQSLALAAVAAFPIGAATLSLGCAGNRYERSTGEYIDDKALSQRVRGALSSSEQFKFDDVNVTAFRGTVQLSGFVNTEDQKSKAGELARTVQGVKGVENNITVKDKMV
jgi:hyperosmotically inducible protein